MHQLVSHLGEVWRKKHVVRELVAQNRPQDRGESHHVQEDAAAAGNTKNLSNEITRSPGNRVGIVYADWFLGVFGKYARLARGEQNRSDFVQKAPPRQCRSSDADCAWAGVHQNSREGTPSATATRRTIRRGRSVERKQNTTVPEVQPSLCVTSADASIHVP